MCFLSDLMEHLRTLSLKPEGKGRGLLCQKMKSSGSNQACELSSWPLGITDFEMVVYYFGQHKVYISRDTCSDEYEPYFTFLQLLLACKPQDVFELPSNSSICAAWWREEFNFRDLKRNYTIKKGKIQLEFEKWPMNHKIVLNFCLHDSLSWNYCNPGGWHSQ